MKASVLATFLATVALTLALVTAADDSSTYRLPKTLITPYHYDLSLTINPESDNFTGTVTIQFTDNDTKQDIKEFYLNANPAYVTISSVVVNTKITCTFAPNETTSLVHITCPTAFNGDKNAVTVVFMSNFSVEASGMFKGSYSEGTKTSWFAATQFEPEYARKAIPCLDEPSYKAIFKVDVTVPSGYSVLFNQELDTVQGGSNSLKYIFKETPKMSTYLLAFFVSKFTFDDIKSDSYDYRVYTRPDLANYTTVATTYGPKILEALGNWTGIKYQDLGIAKSYQVAQPGKSGAMENWGLVLYGEYFLIDGGKETTSVAQKRTIITVMSHELSHQWFGDYVTTDWWSEIWLNEGFADFFENFVGNKVAPEFELDKSFVTDTLQKGLLSDSFTSSLPVVSNENDIYTPAQVGSKFDQISYNKGSSLVRLINSIIGEDSLQTALSTYLKTWKQSNSNTGSLLSILTDTSKVTDLSTYLNTWLYQPGYPLVNVSLSDDGTKLTLKQQRFFHLDKPSTSTTKWYVPITYTTSNKPNFDVTKTGFQWLTPDKELQVDYKDASWAVINLQQIGFFRVNYDEALWKQLSTALKQDPTQFHVLNRAQILDDVFILAKNDYVSYDFALELASFLKNDTEYLPWFVAAKHLTSLLGVTADDEDDTNLRNVIKVIIKDQVEIPSSNSTITTPPQILRQALLLETACRVKESTCLAYATEQYANFKNKSLVLDPNFEQTILCTALSNSEDPAADYNIVVNKFQSSFLEHERIILGQALTCISNATILNQALNDLFTSPSVGSTLTKKILSYLYTNNPIGASVTLDFITNQTSVVIKHFGGTSDLGDIITDLGNIISTDDQIEKLGKLQKDTSVQDLSDKIQKALDKTSINKAWVSTHKDALKSAFKSFNDDDDDKDSASATFNVMFLTILSLLALKLF